MSWIGLLWPAAEASDFPWRIKAECGRAERAHTPCNRNRRKFLLRIGKEFEGREQEHEREQEQEAQNVAKAELRWSEIKTPG